MPNMSCYHACRHIQPCLLGLLLQLIVLNELMVLGIATCAERAPLSTAELGSTATFVASVASLAGCIATRVTTACPVITIARQTDGSSEQDATCAVLQRIEGKSVRKRIVNCNGVPKYRLF